MHSAIFTVVDITDGDLTEEEIEDLGCPYEGYELAERMGNVADYAQDNEGSWEPKDLTDSLKGHPFIKVPEDGVFEIAPNDAFISEEIKRRIERIQRMLEEQAHDDALTHFRACKIMNDEGGYYIVSVDKDGYAHDFQTKDGFILDGFTAGKKYRVVDINDYHM